MEPAPSEIEIRTEELTPRTLPGPWQIAAAQTRGTDHEATGQDCQDVYRVERISPDLLIVAVADGAGSAKLAQVGAGLAANQATAHLSARLAEAEDLLDEITLRSLLHDAVVEAISALDAEASARQVHINELATTLILIIARREDVAVAQVGDGATVIADQAGNLLSLTVPPVTEYINETTFLTAPEALTGIQLVFWRGRATRLAAFSDGLQLLCLQWPERLPYEPFFAPLFEFVGTSSDESQAGHDLAKFLSSEKIKSQTHDDLTLVLASITNCAHED